MVLVVKNLPANVGDVRHMGSIPGSGRSSGVGNDNQFHILAGKYHGQRSLVGGLQFMGSHRVHYD